MQMIIQTPEDMFAYGAKAAAHHPYMLLEGELGAGKTTFAKGYAAGLGIDPDLVHSPTFTYMNIYQDTMLHIDMYRLETADSLMHKGLLEAIDTYDHILIEWPKWTEQYADAGRVQINIQKRGDERDINLSTW